MKHTVFPTLFEQVSNLSEPQLTELGILQRRLAEVTLTLEYPNNESMMTGEDLYSLLVRLYEEVASRCGIPSAIQDFWIYRVLEFMHELPNCLVAPMFYFGDAMGDEPLTLKSLSEEFQKDTVPACYRFLLDLADDFQFAPEEDVFDMVTTVFSGHDNVVSGGFMFCLPSRLVDGVETDDVLYHELFYADVRRSKSGNLWVFCSYPLIGDPEGLYVDYPEQMLWDVLLLLKPGFVAHLAKKHLDELNT